VRAGAGAGAGGRALTRTPSQRFDQIDQIEQNPSAVMRFEFG